MTRQRLGFVFLNVGHFLDHLLMLVFATVAALRLTQEWDLSYAALIPYATPGFIAFGLCAVPAGWLADKWSREGMMAIFFIGIGTASILAAFAQTPLQMGAGLLLIGVFAAIYHPVGLAMVVHGRDRTGMPLAINGVFGNLGVACAALLTGFMIDQAGWRNAFVLPGVVSIAVGLAYIWFMRTRPKHTAPTGEGTKGRGGTVVLGRGILVRVFAIVFFTTAVGGLIFQSTTFALPKVFDERLADLAASATTVGWYAFLVFTIAAFAQLVVGYLVDNHSVRTVFAFVAALQAVFFTVMVQLEGLMAFVVAVGFMLVVFGQIPINDVLVGRMTRSEWRSRVYALRYIVTFSVSATAVPTIAWVHSSWGFGALFALLAVAAGLIFAAVMSLPGSGPIIEARPALQGAGAD
ncbi:MAG: MFS transporter [Gammaproteobacteria bacterium]